MELTTIKLKKIIKEELLNLAEQGQIGQLTAEEAATLRTLVQKASDSDLQLVGLSRSQEKA